MKWISEFDKMHAPDEWIEDTVREVSSLKENRNINGIKTKADKKLIRMSKIGTGNIIKAAAALVTVIAVSATGVYAHNYYTGKYKVANNAWGRGHFDDNGFGAAQKLEENTTVSSQGGLVIKATDLVTEKHKAVIRISVQSKDKPLAYNDAEKISNPARQTFSEIKVKVGDGEIISSRDREGDIYARRIDEAEDPYSAVFELAIKDKDIDFTGQKIVVWLTDLAESWSITKECGFVYESAADIAVQKNILTDDDLIAYNSGSDIKDQEKSHCLKPGNLHISFSTEYPDAYIDNAGFIEKPGKDGSTAFYITVVPGDGTDILKNLVFKNKITGRQQNIVKKGEELLPDGRIQIGVSAGADPYYAKGENKDTADILDDYTLVLSNPDKEQSEGVRFNGMWKFEVQADAELVSNELSAENVAVPKSDAERIHIESFEYVSLTSTEIRACFEIAEDFAAEYDILNDVDGTAKSIIMSKFSDNGIKLVMDDGTRISCGKNVINGESMMDKKYMVIRGELEHFVNTDRVSAVEFDGFRIDF